MHITPLITSKLNFNYGNNSNSVKRPAVFPRLERDTVCFTSKPETKYQRKEYDEKDVYKIIGAKNYVNEKNIQLYKDILNTVDDKYYVHFLKHPENLVDLKTLIERMNYDVDKKSKGVLHCIINDKYINEPDDDEQYAIALYKNDDESKLNKLLTNQRHKSIPHNSASINALTGFLNKKETTDDMTLYRGDTNLVFANLTDKDGISIGRKIFELRRMRGKDAERVIHEVESYLKDDKFTQERFISTTINKSVAEDDFNNGVFWEFHLPKGSQAAFIQDSTDNDTLISEAEILIQRDSLISIKDVKYDKELNTFRIKADVTTTKDHI